MKKTVSIELIKLVASGLGELNNRAVFVGGATVPFYLPKEMAAAARPTEDIDVVIEVVRSVDRSGFEKLLRIKGFENDSSDGAPICRWKFKGVAVDILSTSEKFMGFTNRWYAEGVEHAVLTDIKDNQIKILSLPYFIATKIEAFKGRGDGDYMASSDIEDIITVLDGFEPRTFKLGEQVSLYLNKELQNFLNNRNFNDAIPGHVFDRVNLTARVTRIKENIELLLKQINR
jgi:predicted nucleotidyltransferase